MAEKRSKRRVSQPNWRPNFRNEQRLPDIKVVRTGFLLNFISAVILAAVLAVFGYRELQASILASTVKDLEAEIAEKNTPNRRAIEEYNAFKSEEGTFAEIHDFVSTIISPTEVLAAISDTLPPEAVILSLSYENTVEKKEEIVEVFLRGSMDPRDDIDASTLITAFESDLVSHELLEGSVSDKSLSFRPEPRFPSTFAFDITIELSSKK